jgi:carotenoid cleavage dioxygenase-like enzyme
VRYAYCTTVGDEKSDDFTGVVKFDLAMEPPSPKELSGKRHLKTGGNIAGLFNHGPGRCGGDTFFVPRNPAMTAAAEDDGYLITFVHDRGTGYGQQAASFSEQAHNLVHLGKYIHTIDPLTQKN